VAAVEVIWHATKVASLSSTGGRQSQVSKFDMEFRDAAEIHDHLFSGKNGPLMLWFEWGSVFSYGMEEHFEHLIVVAEGDCYGAGRRHKA